MLKFRKLTTTLSLIAAATMGLGIAAQTARANCISSITIEVNGTSYNGFLSCGSSAGNYIANTDLKTTGDEEEADLLCSLGACGDRIGILSFNTHPSNMKAEPCSTPSRFDLRTPLSLKTASRS